MFIALASARQRIRPLKKLSLADVCTYISHGSVSSQPVHPFWGLKRSSGYVVQPPLVKDALHQLKNIKPMPIAFHKIDLSSLVCFHIEAFFYTVNFQYPSENAGTKSEPNIPGLVSSMP